MELPIADNQVPDHPIHVFMRMMPEDVMRELWNLNCQEDRLNKEKFFARVYNGLQEAFHDEQTFKVGKMDFVYFAEWAKGKDEPPTFLQLSVMIPCAHFTCEFTDWRLARTELRILQFKQQNFN